MTGPQPRGALPGWVASAAAALLPDARPHARPRCLVHRPGTPSARAPPPSSTPSSTSSSTASASRPARSACCQRCGPGYPPHAVSGLGTCHAVRLRTSAGHRRWRLTWPCMMREVAPAPALALACMALPLLPHPATHPAAHLDLQAPSSRGWPTAGAPTARCCLPATWA